MKANIRNWEKGLRPPVYRVFQISLSIFFISSTYFVKYRHDDDFWIIRRFSFSINLVQCYVWHTWWLIWLRILLRNIFSFKNFFFSPNLDKKTIIIFRFDKWLMINLVTNFIKEYAFLQKFLLLSQFFIEFLFHDWIRRLLSFVSIND